MIEYICYNIISYRLDKKADIVNITVVPLLPHIDSQLEALGFVILQHRYSSKWFISWLLETFIHNLNKGSPGIIIRRWTHIKYRLLIQRLVLFFYLRVDQMPLPQGLSRAFSWKGILIWLSLINGASCPACGLRLTPRRTGSIATGGRIESVSWTTPPFNIEEYFFAYGVF